MFNDFSWTIREKFIKKSSTDVMNCSLNMSNLGKNITQCIKLEILLAPTQQGQQDGQVSNIILLLIYWFISNLNPHLIRPIQKESNRELWIF